ncbi:MAG: TA system VapC family ribonuclease toxin [Pyrinomonadaceae bacterium]
MLYLLDSNILIYAKMAASPQHKAVSKWLVDILNDSAHSVMICETTILSFLRISTNAKVFDPPLPIDQAAHFVDDLLNHPHVNIPLPSSTHFADVADVMKKHKFVGNLVMDAHLAALAMNRGAALATADTDFKRLPYLKVFDPTKT